MACNIPMFRPPNPALLLRAVTVMAEFSSAVAPNSPRPVDGVHHGRATKYDYNVCPEVPSLLCKNGSTCAPGVADVGSHEHLDLPRQDSGYYCKCPAGFIGHECGVQVEGCGVGTQSDPRVCYHGSSCRSDGGEDYCDCEGLNLSSGPTDTKFAGTMCEHESTSFCAASLVGRQSPQHQFCTNYGQCVRMVAEGEAHPGCICKDGWLGDHCEISRIASLAVSPQTKEIVEDSVAMVSFPAEEIGEDSAAGWETLAGSSLAFVAAMIVIGLGLMKWREIKDAGADGLAFIFRSGTMLEIGLLLMAKTNRMRQMKDAEAKSDDLAEFQDERGTWEGAGTGDEKTLLGVGDLDPDGSATFGSLTKERDSDIENLALSSSSRYPLSMVSTVFACETEVRADEMEKDEGCLG